MINWHQRSQPSWRIYGGLVLFIVALFLAVALMLVEGRLAPVLHTWAETRAMNLATSAINTAVEEFMAETLSNTTLAHLIRDGNGNLQGVQYDMGEINRLRSQATQEILLTLDNMEAQAFGIPLGQLTGLDFLATRGPSLPVRMIPVAGLTIKPLASFESAGINQTWHRVLLDVQVRMRVAVPLLSEEILVSTQIPLVEEVFMGTVPSWYFAGQENLTITEGRLEFPLK
ncbi:MAG: sporulation protein YunB [Firmicutes bacterium]|nr:sporulation protein YunB [Bacillota bacterium]